MKCTRMMVRNVFIANLLVGLLLLMTVPGWAAEPEDAGHLLREALYQQHVMMDTARARLAYERYFKAEATAGEAAGQRLPGAVENFAALVGKSGRSELAGLFAAWGIPEKHWKNLVPISADPAPATTNHSAGSATPEETDLHWGDYSARIYLKPLAFPDPDEWSINTVVHAGQEAVLCRQLGSTGYNLTIRCTGTDDRDPASVKVDLKLHARGRDDNGREQLVNILQTVQMRQEMALLMTDDQGIDRFQLQISLFPRRVQAVSAQYNWLFRASFERDGKLFWQPRMTVNEGRTECVSLESGVKNYRIEAFGDRTAAGIPIVHGVVRIEDQGRETLQLPFAFTNHVQARHLEKTADGSVEVGIRVSVIEQEPTQTSEPIRIVGNRRTPRADSQSKNQLDQTVSISIKDSGLAYVAMLLGRQSRVDVLVPATIGNIKVNLEVKDVSMRQALEMLAQAAGTKLIITGGSALFEAADDSRLQKKSDWLMPNVSMDRLKQELLDPLQVDSPGRFKLLRVEKKPEGLKVAMLADSVVRERVDAWVAQLTPATMTLSFQIFDLSGETETLISRPRVVLNEGSPAEIRIEGDRENEAMDLKIAVDARKLERGLYQVAMDFSIVRKQGGNQSKFRTRNEFNTSGKYETVLYGEDQAPRYRIEMAISEMAGK